jgi:hypothetical protein
MKMCGILEVSVEVYENFEGNSEDDGGKDESSCMLDCRFWMLGKDMKKVQVVQREY